MSWPPSTSSDHCSSLQAVHQRSPSIEHRPLVTAANWPPPVNHQHHPGTIASESLATIDHTTSLTLSHHHHRRAIGIITYHRGMAIRIAQRILWYFYHFCLIILYCSLNTIKQHKHCVVLHSFVLFYTACVVLVCELIGLSEICWNKIILT